MSTAAFSKVAGAVDNGKSYNVEKVLRSNIIYSDYYRQLCKISDFMELVDEMYNEVTHVEPWMSGNARGPSTAFCILYRLFTLQADLLDSTQIKHLLDHGDSPYIRAIGFLYLRYVCPKEQLEKYLAPYFADPEKFAPSADEKKQTAVGAFVRDLICDQYYFETIFPRVPEVTRRQLVAVIKEQGFSDQALGCGGVGGSRRGHDDGRVRPQSVKAALSVNLGQRAPHVSGTERERRVDASRRHDRDDYQGKNSGKVRYQERSRDRGYDRGYDRRDDRDSNRNYDRNEHRNRDRDDARYDRDDRGHNNSDGNNDRYHPYDGSKNRRRSRSRSRDRGGDERDERSTKHDGGSKPWYR